MSSKILFFVNILLIYLQSVWAYPSFRIAPNVSIYQLPENFHSLLTAVKDVHSCGGHGKFLQFRFEPCTNLSSSGHCEVPGDGHVRKSELEFIPSQNTNSLGLQFVVITDYQITTSYRKVIQQSQVTAEGVHPYITTAYLGANENVKGTVSKVQYIIYREEDDNVEICAEFDLEII